MANVIRVLAALAMVGVALTACGKRGTLEAPEASLDEADAKKGKSATADAAGDSGAKKAKEEQQTFILDPLLR